MNPKFKEWLEEQTYAANPIYNPYNPILPRERGWLIHSVVVEEYGTGYTVWKWEEIHPFRM
jgi:hypothetical protein